MKKSDLDSLMEEALGNIRDDRKIAQEFLNEIANQIADDPEKNRSLSPVAAKHVVTVDDPFAKCGQTLYESPA